MKFKIIPNQQTPRIIQKLDTEDYLFPNIKMLEKFLSFASRQHNCAGLAANQCSLDGERIMERFFAIKVSGLGGKFWDIIIEPKILKYKGKKELFEEGCLTWLGKSFKVYRYPKILVSYYDIKGDLIANNITGFEAQVWQHEIDHLNGVVEDYK